jgi:hypothetical protein
LGRSREYRGAERRDSERILDSAKKSDESALDSAEKSDERILDSAKKSDGSALDSAEKRDETDGDVPNCKEKCGEGMGLEKKVGEGVKDSAE